MDNPSRLQRVNTKEPNPCSLCTTPTQKGVVAKGACRALCAACLESCAALYGRLRTHVEEHDALLCGYWKEHYCKRQALWCLCHEGYASPDTYVLSCREHLKEFSKDYDDGADRLSFVDAPHVEPETGIRRGQERAVVPDEAEKAQFPCILVIRTGGGLGLIRYFDGGKPVSGQHSVWVPFDEIAARWPVILRDA